MKIHPVEVKLFQGDGRTGGQTEGRTEQEKRLISKSLFGNFANAT